MKLTKISNNFHKIEVNNKTVWFSYETPIAYDDGKILLISENNWGKTTGKHLNFVNRDKSIRMLHEALINIIDMEF